MLTALGNQLRRRYPPVGPRRRESPLRRRPLRYTANITLGSITLPVLGDAFTSAITRVVQALICRRRFIKKSERMAGRIV
jgi:hypothetical protein